MNDKNTPYSVSKCFVAGLAWLVEHLTAETEVAGLIPGVGPILRVFK